MKAKAEGGLPAPSLVLAHQVRPLSTRRLSTAIGSVADGTLRDDVVTALRRWLDLTAN